MGKANHFSAYPVSGVIEKSRAILALSCQKVCNLVEWGLLGKNQKMKLNLGLILVFALIAGCAKPHAPVSETAPLTIAPDGELGYTVSCNGAGNSMASCYEQAAELCRTRRAGYITSKILLSNESVSDGLPLRSIVFQCNFFDDSRVFATD